MPLHSSRVRRLFVLGAATNLMACAPDSPSPSEPQEPAPSVEDPVPEDVGDPLAGAQPLPPHEMATVIHQATGYRPAVARVLPQPESSPFQRMRGGDLPSAAKLDALLHVADDVARHADLSSFAGCDEASALSSGCATQVLQAWLPIFWKRSVPEGEIDEMVTSLLGDEATTVPLLSLLEVAMLAAEFSYRLEATHQGRLTEAAVADRLAGFITGGAPDAELLALVGTGQLMDPQVRHDHALRLLETPAAYQQTGRMHRQWLTVPAIIRGNEDLSQGLTPILVTRLDVLRHDTAGRLLQHNAPWTTLFTSTEHFVPPVGVPHFGLGDVLPPEGGFYDFATLAPEHVGVLAAANGIWQSAHPANANPSITRRGKMVLERLMCMPVGSPPPSAPSADPPPMHSAECNADRYLALRDNAQCSACHVPMDDIGLGLEPLDIYPGFRDYDRVDVNKQDTNPNCPVATEGQLPDGTPFTSPGELQRLLVEREEVQDCFTRHLGSFLYGMPYRALPDDLHDDHLRAFRASGWDYPQLVAAMAAHSSFLLPRPSQP